MEGIKIGEEIVEFIETNLPPDKPVAVFSIGQLAFKTRHPIIDLGGISRPSVLSFINSPELTLEWAKREGAAYVISEDDPGAGAILVHQWNIPFAAWTIDLTKFEIKNSEGLWAFATNNILTNKQ
jgi:hypothetical protein